MQEHFQERWNRHYKARAQKRVPPEDVERVFQFAIAALPGIESFHRGYFGPGCPGHHADDPSAYKINYCCFWAFQAGVEALSATGS